MPEKSDADVSLLRHCVATLAYRASKVIRGAPPGFAAFRPSTSGGRTPAEILAHLGDLFDWALSLAKGAHQWHDSKPLAWDDESARFFTALDALTHVGQIALLRRMADAPVKGENYFKADIVAGRVGAGQPRPGVEFN